MNELESVKAYVEHSDQLTDRGRKHMEWLIMQVERLKKDKLHFMEMHSKECKSNEQNLMAYLGEKEKVVELEKEVERLKSDLFQWKKYYEQATGFPATKN